MSYRFPVFYSRFFESHDTGVGHPENAGRLAAVVDYLKKAQNAALKASEQSLPKELPKDLPKELLKELLKEDSTAVSQMSLSSDKQADEGAEKWAEKMVWMEPSDRAVLTDIHRVHEADYVAALKAFAAKGGGYLDADTVMSLNSYEVALLAVAAWLDGVDWVLSDLSSNPLSPSPEAGGQAAFVLARPPGHHAERSSAMGFCLLSNAAIAAHYALTHVGIQRVAILDWDVHHGNGTQALIADHPDIAYCSFHQSPAYPGTGLATETGAHHNVLNLPLPPGSTIADYQQLWAAQALPFLSGFGADLLIVSAGYDANWADPLAAMSLYPADYAWFTEQCLQLNAPVLFGLEGGYDYQTLAESVAATIRRAICDALA